MIDDPTGTVTAEAEADAPRGAVARTRRAHYRTEVNLRDRHSLVADEPVELGGGDEGPTPFDLLCAALGSCITITVRMYADRNGWPLDEVTARVEHQRRGTGSGSREEMEVSLSLAGRLTGEQRARLTEIATRCPMHRTLAGGVAITVHPG